ncbi:MAG TPA: hypothetical protein VMC62_11155 [Longilinea sp.]|nr:hypothetical protein [Longilinea sp.]
MARSRAQGRHQGIDLVIPEPDAQRHPLAASSRPTSSFYGLAA